VRGLTDSASREGARGEAGLAGAELGGARGTVGEVGEKGPGPGAGAGAGVGAGKEALWALGPTRLKTRLLQAMGWIVVQVSPSPLPLPPGTAPPLVARNALQISVA